jgi:hypothetical protein
MDSGVTGTTKFDFKSIPRGVDVNLSAALASYIDVFREITGISDRTISCESGGTSAFLSNWRRGKNPLTLNQYERIVNYMDLALMKKSRVHFDKLGAWINRKLKEQNRDDRHPGRSQKARETSRKQERQGVEGTKTGK